MKRWITGVVIIFLPMVAHAQMFEEILEKGGQITIQSVDKEEEKPALIFEDVKVEAKKFGLNIKDAKLAYRMYRAYVLTQTKPKTVTELVSYVGMCRYFYDKKLKLWEVTPLNVGLKYIDMKEDMEFLEYVIYDLEQRVGRLPKLWKQVIRNILKEEK